MTLCSKLMPLFALFPLVANAAVFDSFECKIELVDAKSGQIAKQSLSFDAGRRSMSMSPSPDVRMDGGYAASSQDFVAVEYNVSAGFSLSYTIATRTLPSGKVEARQNTCMSATQVGFCRRGDAHCFVMSV